MEERRAEGSSGVDRQPSLRIDSKRSCRAPTGILLGDAATVLVGGMENMTQAPHVLRGARKGYRLGGAKLEDSPFEALLDTYSGLMMAQIPTGLAARYGITREEQDAALESQRGRTAAQAVRENPPEEIVRDREDAQGPAGDLGRRFPASRYVDGGAARLKPSFGENGMVTAGNASGIVDGAAALVVTSGEKARAAGKRPLGRIVGWAVVGCDPDVMGIGPAPASRKALADAGLTMDDIDLWEINEAFAGQILSVAKELGLDRARLNVNGGAIALGHPLGATGARLALTLLYELRRSGKKRGLAGACIGGGQGYAMILEA